MNLIADASVVVKWLFRETSYEASELLMEAWAGGRLTLRAPEILAAEVASAIWKRVLREKMAERDAQHLYTWFEAYCPILTPLAGLAELALELALQHKQTVYDCLYVALAFQSNTVFVTADERLCRAFQHSTYLVRPLEEFSGAGGLAAWSI